MIHHDNSLKSLPSVKSVKPSLHDAAIGRDKSQVCARLAQSVRSMTANQKAPGSISGPVKG